MAVTAILSAWLLPAMSAAAGETVKVKLASESIVADGNSTNTVPRSSPAIGSGSKSDQLRFLD